MASGNADEAADSCCDLCGKIADPAREECMAIICVARCHHPKDQDVYHLDCLKKYIRTFCRNMRDVARWSGFSCPKGKGKGTLAKASCPAKVSHSQRIVIKNKSIAADKAAKVPAGQAAAPQKPAGKGHKAEPAAAVKVAGLGKAPKLPVKARRAGKFVEPYLPTEYVTTQPQPDAPKQDPLGRNAAAVAALAAAQAKAAKKNARRAAARQRKQDQPQQEEDDGESDSVAAAAGAGNDDRKGAEEEQEGPWAEVHREPSDTAAVWADAEVSAAWAAVIGDGSSSPSEADTLPTSAAAAWDAAHEGGGGWRDVMQAADAAAAWAVLFGDEVIQSPAAVSTTAASATEAGLLPTPWSSAAVMPTQQQQQQASMLAPVLDASPAAGAGYVPSVIDWLNASSSPAASTRLQDSSLLGSTPTHRQPPTTPLPGAAAAAAAAGGYAAAGAELASPVHLQASSSTVTTPSVSGTPKADLRGVLLRRLMRQQGAGSTPPTPTAGFDSRPAAQQMGGAASAFPVSGSSVPAQGTAQVAASAGASHLGVNAMTISSQQQQHLATDLPANFSPTANSTVPESLPAAAPTYLTYQVAAPPDQTAAAATAATTPHTAANPFTASTGYWAAQKQMLQLLLAQQQQTQVSNGVGAAAATSALGVQFDTFQGQQGSTAAAGTPPVVSAGLSAAQDAAAAVLGLTATAGFAGLQQYGTVLAPFLTHPQLLQQQQQQQAAMPSQQAPQAAANGLSAAVSQLVGAPNASYGASMPPAAALTATAPTVPGPSALGALAVPSYAPAAVQPAVPWWASGSAAVAAAPAASATAPTSSNQAAAQKGPPPGFAAASTTHLGTAADAAAAAGVAELPAVNAEHLPLVPAAAAAAVPTSSEGTMLPAESMPVTPAATSRSGSTAAAIEGENFGSAPAADTHSRTAGQHNQAVSTGDPAAASTGYKAAGKQEQQHSSKQSSAGSLQEGFNSGSESSQKQSGNLNSTGVGAAAAHPGKYIPPHVRRKMQQQQQAETTALADAAASAATATTAATDTQAAAMTESAAIPAAVSPASAAPADGAEQDDIDDLLALLGV